MTVTRFIQMAAAESPGEIAVDDGTTSLRWADVDQLVRRAVNGLRKLDLGPEQRVALFALNSTEAAVAHLAGVLAGVSVVPVNSHLTAPELRLILQDASAGTVLTGPETLPTVLAATEGCERATVIAWRAGDRDLVIEWERWLAIQDGGDPPDDVAPVPQLVYTSGTTGRPKGVILPPRSFAGGRTMSDHLEKLTSLPLAAHGTHLVVGPLYHTGPMVAIRLLALGKPLRIMPRFDAEGLLRTVDQEGIETSVVVPTHLSRLLHLDESVRRSYDLSSLRYVMHTGSGCPRPVKQAILDWWGPVLYEVYGATEFGPTCGIGPHAWLKHPGSVGRPIPPLEAVILDVDGSPLPPNREGLLYFRDPTGQRVHYSGWAADVPMNDGDLFTLGEIGLVDDDGYVFVTDRASDMVVSGGVNLYPAEAEAVLALHPGVADCACIGVPDEDMGEEMIALVVPRAGVEADSAEMVAWCRERLSHHKCPRRIDLVPALPRSDTGKINKRLLRAGYLAELGAQHGG